MNTHSSFRSLLVSNGAAAVACLAVCGATHAQSSVTIYGSLDLSPVSISNLGGTRITRLDGGTTQPDRIGFRGIEDLGGGLKAKFLLESGIATDTGAQINTAAFFNRYAIVGLAGDFGEVSLGHQPDLMFDWVGKTSNGFQLQNFYAFHPGNVDTLANTFQFDNTVRYNTPTWGGFTLGGIYGAGENAAGSRIGRNLSAGANYQMGPWRAAVAYSVENNRTIRGFAPFAAAAGLPATGVMDQVRNTGAGFAWRGAGAGSFGVNGTYTRSVMKAGGREATLWNADIGAVWNVTAADAFNLGYTHSDLQNVHWNTVSLMNIYTLSRRTQIYVQGVVQRASAGQVANLFGAGASSNSRQNIVGAGLHHSF